MRARKIPKDSKERNEVPRKCGWIWLCLMSTCQTALKQGVAFSEAEKMMKEASEKSHDCFKKIVDKELDDRAAIHTSWRK